MIERDNPDALLTADELAVLAQEEAAFWALSETQERVDEARRRAEAGEMMPATDFDALRLMIASRTQSSR